MNKSKWYRMLGLMLVSWLVVNVVAVSAETTTPTIPTFTFVVNSTSDDGDFKPSDNICKTENSGLCTLRAAIEQANSSGVAALILFDDAVMKEQTLTPATAYPEISVPLSIDARKLGSCGNDPEEAPDLLLTIDGSNTSGDGFKFGWGSNDSSIYGLIIGNFSDYAIHISESDNAIIACNYIGVDKSGNNAIGNGAGGIRVFHADGTQIGLTDPADRNLISGNGAGHFEGAGILIKGTSEQTVIRTNVIGMNATGSSALANYNGIIVANNNVGLAYTTTIGGSTSSANLISGNSESGIVLKGDLTHINYNYIGTNWSGSSARPNKTGISVSNSGIGTAVGNTISGNSGTGVLLASGSLTLQSNWIGVRRFGASAVSNGGWGVQITGGTHTINQGNVISGNDWGQIYVAGGATIENNKIGLNAAGTSAITGGGNGLEILEGHTVSVIDNAIFGGVNGYGVYVQCSAPEWCFPDSDPSTPHDQSHQHVEIRGNTIGTNVAGTVAFATNQPAVYLEQASSLTLEDNTIAALNAGADVELARGGNHGGIGYGGSLKNNIHNNRIGFAANGVSLFDSGTVGVLIGVDNAENTLDGNLIYGEAVGVQLDSVANTLSGNLIGGSSHGVAITADQNTLSANFIGTDATGVMSIGSGVGIQVNDVISTTISGNLIGKNGVGVKLLSAEFNHIYGNGIGTNISNTLSVPNGSHGIYLTQGSRNNSIGRNVMAGDFTSPFNQIRNNGGRGILIADLGGTISLDNSMVGNEFSNNGALAIDLASDGVTANDVCDIDEGQNDLQNFPVLTGITGGGDVQGTLNSRPSPPYQIDIYTSASCDGLGHGEGSQYFGSTSIVLGVSGEANFTVGQLNPATPLAYYTAVATNLNTGNTSEFSACYTAGVPTAIVLRGQTALLDGHPLRQLGVLLLVIGLTMLIVRNRRHGMVLLVVMFVVLGATFIPVESVQPLVSAAEEAVASCSAFANLLEDGSSAQSGSGVVVGAVAGTLAAPVNISAIVTEPSSAYDYAGAAAVVSNYYLLSAETTTLAPTNKPFLVGIPVPLGQSPNNLGIALLRNATEVREGGQSGLIWKHAPASYDSSSNLLTFTLNQLTETGQIVTIVHDPLIEQLPAPTRSVSRDVQTGQFSVACFLVACNPAVKAAYEAELLTAYNDFMSHGFRQPNLGSSTAYFDTSGLIPIPYLSPLTTFNSINLTLPILCADYVGQYDPNTMILEICTQALPITEEIRRTIRHELFHAIQFAYPHAWDSSAAKKDWTMEGTAAAAETSSAEMIRSDSFDWHIVNTRLVDEGGDNEYRAQDFWVHYGQALGLPLGYLHGAFESGFTTGQVNAAMGGNLPVRYQNYAFDNAYEKGEVYNGTLSNPCALQMFTPKIVNVPDNNYHELPNHSFVNFEDNTLKKLATEVYEVEFFSDVPFVEVWVDQFSGAELAWKVYVHGEAGCISLPQGDRDLSNVHVGDIAYIVVTNGSYSQVAEYDVRVQSPTGE